MANDYSNPLRPARRGRIDAQPRPTPTYHGESLVPDYSRWMPGLADYYRLQRNRALGVPLGQYAPVPPPASPAPSPSSITDGAQRFLPGPNVGNQLAPSTPAGTPMPAATAPAATSGVKPIPQPNAFPGATSPSTFGVDQNSDPFLTRDWGKTPSAWNLPTFTNPASSSAPPPLETPLSLMMKSDPLAPVARPAPSTVSVNPPASAQPPHLIDGIPSSDWFTRQAVQNQQGNRYASYNPATGAATPATPPPSNAAPLFASQNPDKSLPGTLQARALHSASYSADRPHYTREQLAKMDAASLAALALRPRAPQLQPVTVGTTDSRRENPPQAQALAARALRPRFGPHVSPAASVAAMRTGPRSATAWAHLDPASIAALALQPRALRRSMRSPEAPPPRRFSGLNAALLQPSDDRNSSGLNNVAAGSDPANSEGTPPDWEVHTDPNGYLQPASLAPHHDTSVSADVPGPPPPAAAKFDPSFKTDPDSLLQPAPVPIVPGPPTLFPNHFHIPAEGESQPPLTPERQDRMKQWQDINTRADDLVNTGNRLKSSLTGPQYSGYGEPFESRVENTLSNTVPYLKLFFAPENRAGLLAGAKFIAEENSDIKGIKGAVVDGPQDWNAASGHGRHDWFDFHHEEGKLPALRVPEDWVRGNWMQKLATQAEPLLHDVGPANLKVKTAAEMDGTTSAQGVRDLSKILTTGPGTARVTAGLVHNAMQELRPLIKDKPEDEQAQIIVDYLRKGPEKFWSLVKEHHKISDGQLHAWMANPSYFDSTGGNAPSLQPNPDNFKRSQFEQLRKLLSNTATALPPAMWSPPNY